jgi:hypothetical protein
MLILFITKKSQGTAGESFQQHNEAMKAFRQAHPDLDVISARDIIMADGDLLAPVQSVTMDINSDN